MMTLVLGRGMLWFVECSGFIMLLYRALTEIFYLYEKKLQIASTP